MRYEIYATLSEIRRWTSKVWKINHGLKIYGMREERFPFEFASRNTTEDVIARDWTRNEIFLQQEWWIPTSGKVEERDGPTTTWTLIVGLPLHLWPDTVFTAIENLCGGWIETEDETKLRNHLNKKKFVRKEMVRKSLRSCPSKVPERLLSYSCGLKCR